MEPRGFVWPAGRGSRSVPRVAGWWLVSAVVASIGWGSPVRAQPTPNQTEEGQPEIPPDADVKSLFVDFLHFARLGRFTTAELYAQAMLNHPQLDPLAVLDAASRDPRGVDTLMILIRHSSIGESAQQVLNLIHEGEHLRRKDAERIRANIDLLGGDPQQELFAVQHLYDSGEYAVPHLIRTLLDDARRPLRPRIAHAMTKLGRGAVNPLVMALRVGDTDVRVHVIRALGEIGYPQAAPYLMVLADDDSQQEAIREAARRALHRISEVSGRSVQGTGGELFLGLAEQYYDENDAVSADPRLDSANVWFWDEANQELRPVGVPPRIYGPLLAMRCAEEALRQRHDDAGAIALWLAANIRREARLGLNVESGDPGERGDTDPLHGESFPRALYFSQTAGPRYLHELLARAVQDRDQAVALGAIEALRLTAGESSLMGYGDGPLPLVQAMRFSNLLVRLRAALALGAALPKSPFEDSDLVVPLLAGGVSLTGGDRLVVVDADGTNLNRVVDAFRADGAAVIGESGYFQAIQRARVEFPWVGGFVIATDVSDPPVAEVIRRIRGEFLFATTPVVLLVKPTHDVLAEDLGKKDRFLTLVDAGASTGSLTGALVRLRSESGEKPIDGELARSIALESIETLRRIVIDGRTVFDVGSAESALIAALTSGDERLQVASASVLALGPTPSAQQAVADVALGTGQPESLRISCFAALAESARNFGNLLRNEQVTELVRVVREEPGLPLRTAASRALGAVNISDNRASELIRGFYRG